MLTGRKFVTDTTIDVYIQDKYFEKFFVMELLNAFYSAFSILFAVAHYEFNYDTKNEKYVIYLYSCSIFSIFLLINIFLKEKMKNEFIIIEKTLSEEDNNFITQTKIFKYILIFIVLLVHPNIILKDMTYQSYNTQVKLTVTRNLNEIMLLGVILRVYWIITFIVHTTKYMSSDTNRICQTFYFKTNLIFSLKSLIKTRPLITIFIALIFSILFFSFAIRIFERGISQNTGMDFNRFWNAVWLISITMATVGFGDYTAKTNEGRIIAMVACINGVFLLSLLIIAIANFLQMNSIEINMFIISEKCKINDELNENAKGVITEYFHFLKNKNMFNFTQNNRKNNQDLEKVKLLRQHSLFFNQFDSKINKTITNSKSSPNKISRNNTITNANSSGFRKILFKNARNLRNKLGKFDESYNMTQNFSCENIAFNILYNNFNCIFNDLSEALDSYSLQNDQIYQISNQLSEICDYLEEEKYKDQIYD